MAKYDPLSKWLASLPSSQIVLSFEQIENILGFSLPASARVWMSWWENETFPVRSQCKAWAHAGFHTQQLDLAGQKVVFARSGRS